MQIKTAKDDCLCVTLAQIKKPSVGQPVREHPPEHCQQGCKVVKTSQDDFEKLTQSKMYTSFELAIIFSRKSE